MAFEKILPEEEAYLDATSTSFCYILKMEFYDLTFYKPLLIL